MDILHFYDNNFPPVLKTETPFSSGGHMILLNNYIIGSVMFLDKDFKPTSREEAIYIPDPNWRLYPKEQFLNAKYMYPIDYAFTNYEYNGMYLFYAPADSSRDTALYSRSLRDYFENIHVILRNKRIKDGVKEKSIIKQNKERNKILLKKKEDELRKLIAKQDRDARFYKRQRLDDNQINSFLKLENIDNLKKEILRLRSILK